MRGLRNAILDSSPSYEGVETFVMRLAGAEVCFPRQPAESEGGPIPARPGSARLGPVRPKTRARSLEPLHAGWHPRRRRHEDVTYLVNIYAARWAETATRGMQIAVLGFTDPSR